MAAHGMRGDRRELREQGDRYVACRAVGRRVRIEPEERRDVDVLEDARQHGRTVAFVHVHVRRAAEADTCEPDECRLDLDRLDTVELLAERPCTLAGVRAGL